MLIVAWLTFWLGIVFSGSLSLMLIPWFVLAVLLCATAKNHYTYVHCALMGLIQASWFGFGADILSVNMICMGLAYYNQLENGVRVSPFMLAAITCLSLELGTGILEVNASMQSAVTLSVVYVFRVVLTAIVLRYFIRKVQLQYV